MYGMVVYDPDYCNVSWWHYITKHKFSVGHQLTLQLSERLD